MGDTPAPRGRAALLEKLRQRQEKDVGAASAAASSVQQEPGPARPVGRAALLRRLQESRAGKVGPTPEVPPPSEPVVERPRSDISKIAEGVKAVSISAPPEVEREKVTYRGSAGRQVRLSSNYIKLNVESNRGVFEYEVRFEPDVDSKSVRIKMVNQHMVEMGKVKMFDGGACLYLPHLLNDSVTQFECNLPTGEPVIMSVIYKRKRLMSECLHLYNILFKRIMKVLMYVQMGKNYFNPNNKHLIPQHRLEVFPGFAVTVDELEDGLLLCLDTQHRVLRSQNVYELMTELFGAPNFKEALTKALLNAVILTRYNNKTYRIDDISWETTPLDTFEGKYQTSVTFKEYYKNQYNIDIKHDDQVMLVSRRTTKTSEGGKVEQMVLLVPELSYLTGLTDQMRADFKVMKDVAMYTRITPTQRLNALKTYLDNVSNCPDAQRILSEWGLSLDRGMVDLQGRLLDPEVLMFGSNVESRVRPNADWTRDATQNKVLAPVDIRYWVLFYTNRDRQNAQKFSELITRMSSTMGCRIAQPEAILLKDDRNETYLEAFRNHLKKETQVVVLICPSLRTDRYTVIKKYCCTQLPKLSQVILSRTLANDQKIRAVTQKIAMQINCKLGGSLWSVRFPFKNWMICGMDVYHGVKGSKDSSVLGFVASINDSITRWFSTAIFQEGEIGNYYRAAFAKTLEHYKLVNGTYPAKIVMFRDGVGDGQLDHCRKYEVPQFEEVLAEFDLNIPVTFIIVQKRINTRMFAHNQQLDNPDPGTILDHGVTRRHMEDFFLVPQSVRQGTVNPTHYIILQEKCGLKPDQVQRLAFKLCHLYYNWTGTIRVPAPCQYAHKLASLVGQHIKKSPAVELCDKLFYI